VNLEKLLHSFIALIHNLLGKDRVFGLDISEPSELIKVPSKSFPYINECPASNTSKASSFDHVMLPIKKGSGKIFIKRMDFKIPKGVDGIGTVLPYISNNVIELSSLEIVYWIR
jgi:hypothetical protein